MSSTAVEFGIINTLRTGNTMVDTFLCMLIPVIIQWILRVSQNHALLDMTTIWDRLATLLFGNDKEGEVFRVIELTERFNQYGRVHDYTQKNHLLQKAVANYLADELELLNKNARYELMEKRQGLCPLLELDTQSASDNNDKTSDTLSEASTKNDSVGSEYDDDDDADDDSEYGDDLNEVQKLNVGALPPLNQWIEVEPGVWFMHQVNDDGNNGDNSEDGKKLSAKLSESKVVYCFKSRLPDASKRIDRLLERAFQRYKEYERQRCVQDQSRYMYIQAPEKSSSSSGNGEASGASKYKRYALGEEKTFENLFFEGKELVVQLLDNFLHRKGKFAIKGFPYKLGLLLHGPPGTGKTSLIKAVAQYTKRHIVTISLARIKTNQELMDQLFDLKFMVDDLDYPVRMNFEDVVFVMEDIDCASSVVMSRSEKQKSAAQASATSNNSNGVHTDNQSQSQSHSPVRATGGPNSCDSDLVSLLLNATMSSGGEDGAGSSNSGLMAGPKAKPDWWKTGADELNLSGLLNVLDGIIDCPGRIVIMTTNHPEKLDPALIRPGRVNKRVLLDFVRPRQIVCMFEYYFATPLSASQLARVESYSSEQNKKWTPAQIEQLCAEFDDVEDAVLALATLPPFVESIGQSPSERSSSMRSTNAGC